MPAPLRVPGHYEKTIRQKDRRCLHAKKTVLSTGSAFYSQKPRESIEDRPQKSNVALCKRELPRCISPPPHCTLVCTRLLSGKKKGSMGPHGSFTQPNCTPLTPLLRFLPEAALQDHDRSLLPQKNPTRHSRRFRSCR